MKAIPEKTSTMQVALSTIVRDGHGALRPGGMVHGTGRLCHLGQSGRIQSRKHASTFFGRRGGDSFGMDVAETGFHNAGSTFGSHVRVFPDAGRGESWILGFDLPFSSGGDLPVHLLHCNARVSLACWVPPLIGLRYSVVAYGVSNLFAAFDVPRWAGKRFHFHLATR
jgi:hypothetical protein